MVKRKNKNDHKKNKKKRKTDSSSSCESVVTCKYCGGTDHQRRSSHQCKNQLPKRGSKQLPSEGFKYKEYKTVKCGFNRITKYPSLIKPVNDVSTTMTYICFEGSRLLNLHLLKLAETTGSKLPSITENYVRWIILNTIYGRPMTIQIWVFRTWS